MSASLFQPANSPGSVSTRRSTRPKASTNTPNASSPVTVAQTDGFPWRSPDEMPYMEEKDIPQSVNPTQSTLIEYLRHCAFSIPPREANSNIPLFQVTTRRGPTFSLPRGYRVPLMFVAKFQWDSLKLVLTSSDPQKEWEEYKLDIVHLSRLCHRLFAQAEDAKTEALAKGAKGIDRLWRSATFDRVLTRFYYRWFVSRDRYIRLFWEEYDEDEYEDDVLKYDWVRWSIKGHKGFDLTKDEIQNGITINQFLQGLEKNAQGNWTWNVAGSLAPQPTAIGSTSANGTDSHVGESAADGAELSISKLEEIFALLSNALSHNSIKVKKEHLEFRERMSAERTASASVPPKDTNIIPNELAQCSKTQPTPVPVPPGNVVEQPVVVTLTPSTLPPQKNKVPSNFVRAQKSMRMAFRRPIMTFQCSDSSSSSEEESSSSEDSDDPNDGDYKGPRKKRRKTNHEVKSSTKVDHLTSTKSGKPHPTVTSNSARHKLPQGKDPKAIDARAKKRKEGAQKVAASDKAIARENVQTRTPITSSASRGSAILNPPVSAKSGSRSVPGGKAGTSIASISNKPSTNQLSTKPTTNLRPGVATNGVPIHSQASTSSGQTAHLPASTSKGRIEGGPNGVEPDPPSAHGASKLTSNFPIRPIPNPKPCFWDGRDNLLSLSGTKPSSESLEIHRLFAGPMVCPDPAAAVNPDVASPPPRSGVELTLLELTSDQAVSQTPPLPKSPPHQASDPPATSIDPSFSQASSSDPAQRIAVTPSLSTSCDAEPQVPAVTVPSTLESTHPISTHPERTEEPTLEPTLPLPESNHPEPTQQPTHPEPVHREPIQLGLTPLEPRCDPLVSTPEPIPREPIDLELTPWKPRCDPLVFTTTNGAEQNDAMIVDEPIIEAKDPDEEIQRLLTSLLSNSNDHNKLQRIVLVLRSLLCHHRRWRVVAGEEQIATEHLDLVTECSGLLSAYRTTYSGLELVAKLSELDERLYQELLSMGSLEMGKTDVAVQSMPQAGVFTDKGVDAVPLNVLGLPPANMEATEPQGLLGIDQEATRESSPAIPVTREPLTADATMVDLSSLDQPPIVSPHQDVMKTEASLSGPEMTPVATRIMTSVMRNMADLLDRSSGAHDLKGKGRMVDEVAATTLTDALPIVGVLLQEFKSMKEDMRKCLETSRAEMDSVARFHRMEVNALKDELRSSEDRYQREAEGLKQRHRQEIGSLVETLRQTQRDGEKDSVEGDSRSPMIDLHDLRRRISALEGHTRSFPMSPVLPGSSTRPVFEDESDVTITHLTATHPLAHLFEADDGFLPPSIASVSKAGTPVQHDREASSAFVIDESVPLPIKSQRKFVNRFW